MNKLFKPSQLTSYEADYARWSEQQGALLRERRYELLDIGNLAEEIESLGRSQRHEIESRLRVLLIHLLKLRYQPEKAKGGWRSTVREQRRRISHRLNESPSLVPHFSAALPEEYESAREDAADETGLPSSVFPAECPFAIEQLLDRTFFA